MAVYELHQTVDPSTFVRDRDDVREKQDLFPLQRCLAEDPSAVDEVSLRSQSPHSHLYPIVTQLSPRLDA